MKKNYTKDQSDNNEGIREEGRIWQRDKLNNQMVNKSWFVEQNNQRA